MLTRQTRRTKKLIYDAFSKLLLTKTYSKITMQEIADTADVGRSTVYSHFETKEMLLFAMCSDIFTDLINHENILESSHDDALVQLLAHIKNNKKIIMGIVLSDGVDVLIRFCKEYFGKILETSILSGYDENKSGIPKDCLINHLVVSFIELVRWWAEQKMKQNPEEIAIYYKKFTAPVIVSLMN